MVRVIRSVKGIRHTHLLDLRHRCMRLHLVHSSYHEGTWGWQRQTMVRTWFALCTTVMCISGESGKCTNLSKASVKKMAHDGCRKMCVPIWNLSLLSSITKPQRPYLVLAEPTLAGCSSKQRSQSQQYHVGPHVAARLNTCWYSLRARCWFVHRRHVRANKSSNLIWLNRRECQAGSLGTMVIVAATARPAV